MAKTLTRKQELESAAKRVGNAAAHRLAYDDAFGNREAKQYEEQSRRIVNRRAWNDQEIAHFRRIAIRRANKELAIRVNEERGLSYEVVLEKAILLIDEFIEKEMRR